MKQRLIGFLFLITFFPAFSQTEPSIELRTFNIIDSSLQFLRSSSLVSFDSLHEQTPRDQENMVDFLSRRTPMNFKNYGPGLLATPTFRGGDANHTQVVWNGMTLNSPMLGTVDFATFPVRQFSSIKVLSANSSNLYSSGGIGGTVALSQEPSFTRSFSSVSVQQSSFDHSVSQAYFNLPFDVSGIPMVFGASADAATAANRFPFTDITTTPLTRKILQNNRFERNNSSVFFGIAPHRDVSVSLIYWYSEVDREIPGPINVSERFAEQKDEAHRAMATTEWYAGETLTFRFRSMFEDNSNQYNDELLNISNNNQYSTSQNQLEAELEPIRNLKVAVRGGYQWIAAESENYVGQISVERYSGLASANYILFDERLELEGGYRFEQFIAQRALLPFGGISYKPLQKLPLSIFASASESIRFPTLNERYWKPGGNENLQPEEGTMVELGLRTENNSHNWQITGFYGEYRNRIRWLPTAALFIPTNVSYSEVSGIELSGESTIQLSQNRFKVQANMAYQQALGGGEQSELNQLSFVPEWSGNAALIWQKNEWTASYTIHYTGLRYITNDESAYMPEYWLQSFGVQYAYDISAGLLWTFRLSADNTADWQYQNMPWRPMPGRSFTLRINVKWDQEE